MSGGHFDYIQYQIAETADRVRGILESEADYYTSFSEETKAKIRKTEHLLRLAAIYLHRVDWFVSGDDGEDTFHTRLDSDLKQLKKTMCDDILRSMVGKDNVHTWWNSKNKHFDNETPLSVWETDHESVVRYILDHANK